MMTVEVCGRVAVPSVSPGGSSSEGGAGVDDAQNDRGVPASPARDTTADPPVHRPKFMITDILAQRGPPTPTEDHGEGGGASAAATDSLKRLNVLGGPDDDQMADDGGQHDDDDSEYHAISGGEGGGGRRGKGWKGREQTLIDNKSGKEGRTTISSAINGKK